MIRAQLKNTDAAFPVKIACQKKTKKPQESGAARP